MTYRIMNDLNELLSTFFENVDLTKEPIDYGTELIEWWQPKDSWFSNSYDSIDEAKVHATKLNLTDIRIVEETVTFKEVA